MYVRILNLIRLKKCNFQKPSLHDFYLMSDFLLQDCESLEPEHSELNSCNYC